MVTFGEEGYTRLLALGGISDGSSTPDVEWYEEDEGYWQQAWGRLRTPRSYFGGEAVTPEMVCSGRCGQDDCTEELGRLVV